MNMPALKIQPRQNGFHCESCDFLKGCIIGNLPKDKLRELRGSVAHYEIKRKGGYVFNQGEPSEGVYFLCSGLIKLVTVLESGQEVILDLVIPFSVLSANPTGAEMSHKYSAVVVSNCARIAYAKQGVLENWMRWEPLLGVALFHHYCEKVERSYTSIAHRVYDVRGRFLLFLGYYMSAFEAIRNGELLVVHLSRDELARVVQTTPETISRLLHRLKEEGLVAPATERGVLLIKWKILRELLDEHNETIGGLI